MKKRILGLVLALFLVLTLAACSSASNPVDISVDLNCQIQSGKAFIDRYDGNEKHVKIPDYLEGAKVTYIAQSFASGKSFESVVLPGRIQGCYKDENGQLVLTTYSDSGIVPINEKTAPWIYCTFFGTDSIQVNGVKYEYKNQAATDDKIIGDWTDGETRYTFTADKKITIHAASEAFEGTWQRQDNIVTMHMSEADFDDNDLDMEYCGAALISWEYAAVLYQGDVPADPEYNESSNGGNAGPLDEKISGDFMYTEVEGEIWLIKYIGTDPVVHIPTTLEGKPVTLLQLDCNDAIREIYIPGSSQLSHINGFSKTVGLEIVHWENVGSVQALVSTLHFCYDLKELYITGLTSLNLFDIDRILRNLTLLDISDCREVIGGSLPTVTEGTLEVRVSTDIKYLHMPKEMHGEMALSATPGNMSVEITDATWMEAWDMIFGGYTDFTVNGVKKTQEYNLTQTLMNVAWWEGCTPDGQPNGKLMYVDDRGFIYVGEMTSGSLQQAVSNMQQADFDRLGLFGLGDQVWNTAENFKYRPLDLAAKLIGRWENPMYDGTKLSNLETITLNADGTAQVRNFSYDPENGQEFVYRDETMTYVLQGNQVTITAAGQTTPYGVFCVERGDAGELRLKVTGGELDKGYLICFTLQQP